MPEIHPTAIIDSRVELADDVKIGAFCILKGTVKIGAGSVIHDCTHIHGHTIIGRNTQIGPSAFIGLAPQHLKYNGQNTSLIIGDDCLIRESASVHRSTHEGLERATRLGDRCFLMGGSHVAHDCVVGNDVVMANAALIGGHATLGERAFLGGGATVHQFVHIGRIAIVGGNEAITRDVPPFAAVRYRGLKGYNAVGCKRSGMSRQVIHAIRAAYLCIHSCRSYPEAVAEIKQTVPLLPEIRELLDFIAKSQRGVLPSNRMFQSSQNFTGSLEQVAADNNDD